MVRHKLSIARMNYRLGFGHEGLTGKTNPNTGNQERGYVEEFTRWAAKWSLTQYMSLQLQGAGIKDAYCFAIRHDPTITSDYLVRLGVQTYIIDHIQYDEGRTADAYDLIYCHKEKKYG